MGAQTGKARADEIAKQSTAEASPARNALLITVGAGAWKGLCKSDL